MKLVKQTKLKFQDSKSDKVYEVDLCDAGNNTYLVNFRYGRRGATLKEGTKTESPISLEKAEKTFNTLVASKKKKGYVDEQGTTIQIDTPLPTNIEGKNSREKAILSHLDLAIKNPSAQVKKNWSIKRVMWRAGELRLKSAIPYLLHLLGSGDDIHTYSCIWALGRCGVGSEGIKAIQNFTTGARPQHIKNLATIVVLDITEGVENKKIIAEISSKIPPVFLSKIEEKNTTTFQNILNEFVNVRKTKKFDFLVNLYLISNEYPQIKKPLTNILKTIPFRPPYFKAIRSIFKLSEYRNDGQFYGMLAYRFEKENHFFNRSKYSSGVWSSSGWISNVEAELKKENSKLAFSNQTKSYINRRIWKTLHKLTEEKDIDYVKIATGILLSYDKNKDYKRPSKDVTWKYNNKTRRYNKKTLHFDSYANSLLMNYILYANSSRYQYSKDRKKWHCIGTYRPGMEAPKEREEACPELWDKIPKVYIHLLAESNVEKINEFALKNLKDHKEYKNLKNKIDFNLIQLLIQKKYKPTAVWGLNLAKEKYNPENPNRKLTLIMISSELEEARTLAKKWISENYNFYFSNTDFILSMTLHQHKDIRDWMKKDMPVITKNLTKAQKQVLVGRVISHMLNLENNNNTNLLAKEYGETLLLNFSDLLKTIGFDIIKDLLQHKLEENQKFAGELILRHETPAEKIPTDLFNEFLHAKKSFLREIGIKLFGQFSDNSLLGKQDELIRYATSKLADVRTAVKPVIKKLANQYESFAEDCVNKFVPVLLRKETYEGVHQDTFNLLTNELKKHLKIIERKKIFRLLNSEHTMAQELGTVLVDKYIPAESLSVSNIIRLANHEILSARQVAWRMFNENVARMKYEREDALRLMDSDWEDTRNFSFDYFRKNYKEKDWTPELLVGICDSVRKDVSSFGRELITQYFKEEDGTNYLMKLSQHPTSELQLFATNYLERFASDDLEKLKNLEFFFVTVLSQVNKGRVAKNRVLHFLRNEAMKLPEAAEIVVRILDNLSLTIAIGDKSTCIEMMRDIHEKYPEIKIPISLKPVES